MSGIIDYFHGESGDVAGRFWVVFDERLVYHLEVAGNPHRIWARDYDQDIGIDPALAIGDKAMYLRLDATSGIWLRTVDQHGDALSAAIGRVRQHRRWVQRWEAASGNLQGEEQVARELVAATGEGLWRWSTVIRPSRA